MAKQYTSIFDVFNDTQEYMSLREGAPLSLGNVQQLAVARWPFIVSNFNQLKQNIIRLANGDSDVLTALNALSNVVVSYNLGNVKYNPFSAFTDFVKYNPVLKLLTIPSLQLTPAETTVLSLETQRIMKLEIPDFQSAVSFLKTQYALGAQSIGLGDPDADALLGIGPGKTQRSATIDDIANLQNIIDLQHMIEGIIFDLQQTAANPPDLLKISNQNIDPSSPVRVLDIYSSYIPIPYEISIESMAKKYLGSVDRWYELATVNNLQPPYIDEVGVKYSLLAPGATNNVIVSSDSTDNIAVGLKIKIGSYSQREEARVVERIIVNQNNTTILFLSGAQDISRFKPVEGAYIRVYAPGTTRTGEFVKVPLAIPGFQSANPTPTSDALRELDAAFIAFGIDIARDPVTKDFQIDPNGNFKYAVGLMAIQQAVLTALTTTQGSLPFHPQYGVNTNIGDRFYGTQDEALVFGQLLRNSILSDSRFSDVQIASVSTTGSSLSIKMFVSISGYSGGPIPLTFST